MSCQAPVSYILKVFIKCPWNFSYLFLIVNFLVAPIFLKITSLFTCTAMTFLAFVDRGTSLSLLHLWENCLVFTAILHALFSLFRRTLFYRLIFERHFSLFLCITGFLYIFRFLWLRYPDKLNFSTCFILMFPISSSRHGLCTKSL